MLSPMLTLISYIVPDSVVPLTPEAILQSLTSPPKLGVNPPGNISLNTKQFGLTILQLKLASEAEPLPEAEQEQLGMFLQHPQLLEPTSRTMRVAPPSVENIPPLLVGFLKKKPPRTFLSA